MVLNKFTKPAGLLFQTDHFLQFTCVPLQHAPEWMNTNNTQNACALPPPKKKKKKIRNRLCSKQCWCKTWHKDFLHFGSNDLLPSQGPCHPIYIKYAQSSCSIPLHSDNKWCHTTIVKCQMNGWVNTSCASHNRFTQCDAHNQSCQPFNRLKCNEIWF